MLEEITNKDGFVTVFDEDGLITIQMSEESVSKIVDKFDTNIKNSVDVKSNVEVTEFGNTFTLTLNLINKEDYFNLTAISDTGNFYHDFELEECSKSIWDEIKKILKK